MTSQRAANRASADDARPTLVLENEPIEASILVVDDHPANLLAIEGILEPLGHRLIAAGSGEEALKRLLDEDFAVILLDVQMRGLDGVQTARIIKEREKTRHIPIMFLTAISRDQVHIFRGYSAGAVDYLLKPFDPDILRAKVQVFVDLWIKGKRLERREAFIRQRERELLQKQSEERFRHVTDVMPLAVLAGTADGSIYWANAEWKEYTGLSLAQTAAGAWLEIVHPDDRERLVAARRESIASGTSFELEYRIRRHDGVYRWFLVRAADERDAQGNVTGWIGTHTDIDDQKRDREHLAEFKATLDATFDCVFVLRASDLGVSYANHGAMTQLGYERDELFGLHVWDIEPQFDDARFRELVEPLRDGSVPALTYATQHLRSDGSEFPVEVVLQHIAPLEGGKSGGRFISVARDIRERVRAETALRRANEAKDAFIAAASHELRTPLAAAKAQTQLALRRLREDPESPPARSLRTISGQIDRMAKLVEDLLDVSKVQVGRLALEVADLDVCAVVRESAERLQVLSESHRIVLSLPDAVNIVGDRSRLDQVVTNLLSNAIRYSPMGGEVTVTVEPEPSGVHLTVGDQGVGIPPEQQAVVFERFGRAHGSQYGGLGLGLTIAQGIVEQHGGQIWVESTGVPGEGCCFHVRLPRVATTRATQP